MRLRIIKALTKAKLPANDRNIDMVEELLKEGFSMAYALQMVGTTGEVATEK